MKRFLFYICFLFLPGFYLQAEDLTSSEKSVLTGVSPLALQDSIINFSKNHLNIRYRSGGSTTKGFDCSGFVHYVYGNFGFQIGRSSRDQAGKLESLDPGKLKAGDLVFFNGRRRGKNIGHVGIVTEADSSGKFKFIHSETSSGITISSSEEPYYKRRFVKAGRVIQQDTFLYASRVPVAPKSTIQEVLVVTQDSIRQNSVRVHKVKKGDTLYALALKYNMTVDSIRHMNGLEKSALRIGQELVLDKPAGINTDLTGLSADKAFVVDSEQKNAEKPVKKAPTKKTHKVKKGDSFYSIAQKYGCTVAQLKDWNGKSGNKIMPGDKIIIKLDKI